MANCLRPIENTDEVKMWFIYSFFSYGNHCDHWVLSNLDKICIYIPMIEHDQTIKRRKKNKTGGRARQCVRKNHHNKTS